MLRKTKRKIAVRSEVNLTPLIDVMTSLLAIFMITAPLLTTGIAIDLPKGDGKPMVQEEKNLELAINQKKELFLADVPVEQKDLLRKMKAIVAENPQVRIVISADKNINYGFVVELMALLRDAGYVQVGLKTDAQVVSSLKGL